MKNIFLFVSLLLVIIPFSIKSQSVNISIKVLQGFSPQTKLYLYNGTQIELVDSSTQVSPGEYHFTLHPGYSQGLYRADIGKGMPINFVVSDEPIIDISTVFYAPEDSLKSLQSIENKVYWKFLEEKKNHSQQSWLIRSLFDFYPDSVMFYHLLHRELDILENKLYSSAKSTYEQNPDLLSAKLIFTEQHPFISRHIDRGERSKALKNIWWSGVDLFDIRLLNSPAIANHSWGYIELFHNDDFDKEEQELAFIECISDLLNMEMHTAFTKFIRSLLIEGFSSSDYKEVVDFLETTSFNGLEALRNNDYEMDNNALAIIKVGEKAYDFYVNMHNTKKIKLSKIKAEYKLLVFWSTWCPHCIESLPQILDIYQNYKSKGLEVIAISIDDEENLWRDYVDKLNLHWINMREPYSNTSKLFTMYDVQETPKMFLLSKDLTIISRPYTRRQLEVKLKRVTK